MNFLSNLGQWSGWLTGFYTIVPFLFVLTIVVFFHELGHFLVARWCGVRVLVFSIGFGPELVGFNDRHGTRWKLAAVPLGGYVKFFGDESVASTPDLTSVAAMTEAEKRESFFHQPVIKRAAIVVAGPLANFVLAIVIFGLIALTYGKLVTTPRLDVVQPGTAAAAAGFKTGDVVLAIDGRNIESFSDLKRIVASSPGRPLQFAIDRSGEKVTLTATPEARDETDPFGHPMRIGVLDIDGPVMPARIATVAPGMPAAIAGMQAGDVVRSIDGIKVQGFLDIQRTVRANPGRPLEFVLDRGGRAVTLSVTPEEHGETDRTGAVLKIGRLGISGAFDPADMRVVKYGPLGALSNGADETWFVVDRTFSYLAGLIVGRESANQLGGPIRIAVVSGEAARLGFDYLMRIAAIISVSIGLLNLFPIPLLDGGHLMFYGIEALRGRPLSEKAQEVGFRIGLAIVLMLMIFATYNDILLTFFHRSAS